MVMQNLFYPGNNKKNFQNFHLQCSLSSVYEMLWLISQESELSILLKDLVMK